MSTARNLALEALIAITNQLERVGDTRPHKDGQFIDAARAAIAALEAETGEPVAWQWRKNGEPWSLDQTFNAQVFATTKDSEVRALYAAPGAPS